MSRNGPDLGEQIIGYMMIAGGVLIALLSGACSISLLAAPSSSASVSLGEMTMVAVFGGLPFCGGVGLVIGGLALLRRRKADRDVF